MSKDTKLTKDTKITEETGASPRSSNLTQSLATFREIANAAVKNAQAENVISGENNVANNIKKPSRQTGSQTLMGLAKFKGFKGTTKKS